MEKQLKDDKVQFEVTSGITIEEFNEKYNQLIWFLKDKYGYITDVKISCHSYEYNDGEEYYEEININYSRYETDEEFERRSNWIENINKEQREHDLEKLKECIEKYPEIAKIYMNELIKK